MLVGHVRLERTVDERAPLLGEPDDATSRIPLARAPFNEPGLLESIDPLREAPARDHGALGELARRPGERLSGAAQRGEHVELAGAEPERLENAGELRGEVGRDAMQPPDDALRRDVDVRPLSCPLLLDARDVVTGVVVIDLGHAGILPSPEDIISSMENNWRWMLVAAIAPVAWGSTYVVTAQLLPADAPLWGSVLRALPAGLLLLALPVPHGRRRLPAGAWWWRSLVLGTLNVGAFFILIYLAAQLLPSSVAAMLMATSPAAMMLIAWPLLRERPHVLPLIGAALGFAGVALMLATGSAAANPLGVLASLGAMTMSAFGFVLTKRWSAGVPLRSLTAWQLTAGGLAIMPAALLVEGAPPALGLSAWLGFAYVTLVATALAYVAWFSALRRLPAASVGLVGLLNPVTGVGLGAAVAGEGFTALQIVGMALVLVGILLGQPIARRVFGRRVLGRRCAPAADDLEPVSGAAGPVPAGSR